MNKLLARSQKHFSAYQPMLIVSLVGMLIFWLSFSTTQSWSNIEQTSGLHMFFKLRGPRPAPENINLVAINSSAAEALDLPAQSPSWPRTVYAEAIQRLSQAGARLIVVDINFKEARSEQEDAALENAIAHAGNVVLVTYLKRQQINSGSGIIDIEEELPPIERFAQHAAAVGPFTLPKFPAKVASTELMQELSSGSQASQPLAAYKILRNTVPDFSNKKSYINFYGPDRTLKTQNIDFVLTAGQNELSSIYQDKIVYLGYSDPAQTEQKDAYRTVFSSKTGVDLSGVEISATVLANLLDDSLVKALSANKSLLLVALFFLITVLCCFYFSLLISSIVQITLLLAYFFFAQKIFNQDYLWLPLLLPAIMVFSLNIVIGIAKYRKQKQLTQQISSAIANYLPAEAAAKLSQSFVQMENQHQLVWGVCLMSDIRGYTRLSENTPPHELHQLMNRYYKVLLDEVEKRSGIIGNIVGDSMLALWTGPELNQSMCLDAVETASAIQKELALQPEFECLPTGFAIHGGQFSLGNLGAQGHFEYSPVGDIINTTSRIEPFNRKLSTTALCTNIVQNLLAGTEHHKYLREVGDFDMHNKAKETKLFKLDLAQDTVSEAQERLQSSFATALHAYRFQEYETALDLFTKLVNEFPDDGPARYYYTLLIEQKN